MLINRILPGRQVELIPGVETPPGFCPREKQPPRAVVPGTSLWLDGDQLPPISWESGSQTRCPVQTPWSIQVRGALPIDPRRGHQEAVGSGEWGRQRPGSLSQIEGELAKIPVCEAGERTEKIKEKRF